MAQYLDEKLIAYSKSDIYPFHMPGHKRHPMGEWIPEDIDITEIDGFDNLHHAEDILLEAQNRMAELFGAAKSFFLVNGSTAGLLAAISGSVNRGDLVLVARNCHKAVYHALYLLGLQVEYLYPLPTDFGIQGSIDSQEVEEKLASNPQAKAVILTSPTYDGITSDIKTIAKLVHEKQIPLIVDEAHGAHFGFSEGFPQKALAFGADLVIESLHKTLPSYTQTAVLHVGKNEDGTGCSPYVNLEKIQRYLGIYQTSSPSYIFMAGMDRCSRIIKEQGEKLFSQLESNLSKFYKATKEFQYIEVFEAQEQESGIFAQDTSKILISARKAGLNGQQLWDILLDTYHLQMEMASGHYVCALCSLMDTKVGFSRLLAALRSIEAKALQESDAKKQEKTASWECGAQQLEESASQEHHPTPVELYQPRKKAMEISEAMDAPKREVALEDSLGCVSGEFIYLYPPGIPLITPGEVMTEDVLAVLKSCVLNGLSLQGMCDLSGKKLLICADEGSMLN